MYEGVGCSSKGEEGWLLSMLAFKRKSSDEEGREGATRRRGAGWYDDGRPLVALQETTKDEFVEMRMEMEGEPSSRNRKEKSRNAKGGREESRGRDGWMLKEGGKGEGRE